MCLLELILGICAATPFFSMVFCLCCRSLPPSIPLSPFLFASLSKLFCRSTHCLLAASLPLSLTHSLSLSLTLSLSGTGSGTGKEKARISGAGRSSSSLGRKKVSRPRFAFQTRSANDILDDGYRWRKYSAHPRFVVRFLDPSLNYYLVSHHSFSSEARGLMGSQYLLALLSLVQH